MLTFALIFHASVAEESIFFSDTALDSPNISGLGYLDYLPGSYHRVWCCTLMHLELVRKYFSF